MKRINRKRLSGCLVALLATATLIVFIIPVRASMSRTNQERGTDRQKSAG